MHKVLDDGYLLAENVSLQSAVEIEISIERVWATAPHGILDLSGIQEAQAASLKTANKVFLHARSCWNSLLLLGTESGDLRTWTLKCNAFCYLSFLLSGPYNKLGYTQLSQTGFYILRSRSR